MYNGSNMACNVVFCLQCQLEWSKTATKQMHKCLSEWFAIRSLCVVGQVFKLRARKIKEMENRRKDCTFTRSRMPV